MPLLDPNNARNRWRRKRAAFIAYGWSTGHWSFPTLRQFIKIYPADAYCAGPRDLEESFQELLQRSKPKGS